MSIFNLNFVSANCLRKPRNAVLFWKGTCLKSHYLYNAPGFIYFFQHDAASLSLESGGRLAGVMNSVVSLRHQVRSYALLQDENSAKVSPRNMV